MKFSKLWLILFFSLTICCKESREQAAFKLMEPSETNIHFNNEIKETVDFNPLNFIYIYNGAGVGVIDINNDGLPDLYFAGNKVSSKMYLNKGNLKFEDITESAGLSTTNWATGVSIVDINADGFQDIYLCMAHKDDTKKSKNKLFINQRNNSFVESSAAYGIDDDGYSTQAVFFDYDNDEDLDLYLLTNAIEDFNHNNIRPIKAEGTGASTDRLYRNNGDNTFTNISVEAGIDIEGYGLGVGILDVNNDGYEDIYCANDFITNDLLWVNNGDGTFRNGIRDYLSQTAHNGMGIDIADFDNDGLMDIVEMDMLPESNEHHKTMTPAMDYNHQSLRFQMGYLPQYVRNTLQKRNDDHGFSEVGRLAEIHKTDWSWAPLLFDFDNDGLKDLFITNGYGRDVTDLDYTAYGQQANNNPFGTPEAKKEREYENFQKLGPIDLPNYFFKNVAGFPFEDISASISKKPSISNGAVYVDLDRDGDLDLVANNMNSKAFVYKNLANDGKESGNNYLSVQLRATPTNLFALGARLKVYHGGRVQAAVHYPVRGYASSVTYGLNFGLGNDSIVDSILVQWPNKKIEAFTQVNANQTLKLVMGQGLERNARNLNEQKEIWFKKDTVMPKLYHTENDYVDFMDQPLLLKMMSREGPAIAIADIDNNGLEDIVLGKAYGDTTFVRYQIAPKDFSKKIALTGSWEHEDSGIAIFDINGDGNKDIYVASGGNEFASGASAYYDRIHLQNENGDFDVITLDEHSESSSTVNVADFDGDGDLDLFVGSRLKAHSYPLPASSRLMVNEHGALVDATKDIAPELETIGMVTSALWTDFNNDSRLDLIVVGEWMAPQFFENRNGRLQLKKMDNSIADLTGFWNSINGADLDLDGDIDYVLGNYGLNAYLKASPEEPASIVAKDFDGNGNVDPIIGYYSQGTNYPFPSRDALTSQINGMKKRFPFYKDYAQVEYDGLFTKKERTGALEKQVTNLATIVLENEGNGNFKTVILPYQAQLAPVYGIAIEDIDKNNYPDIILVGNRSDSETLGGFTDGSLGTVLLGEGSLKFKSVGTGKSGFNTFNRDSRALAIMTLADGYYFWTGNNNGPTEVYGLESETPSISIEQTDIKIEFSLENGDKIIKELYINEGYLTQNSGKVGWPKGAVSAVIHTSKGETKKVVVGKTVQIQ